MIKSLSLNFIVFSLLLLAGCAPSGQAGQGSDEIAFSNIEFEMPSIKKPVIPDYRVNLTDFGAVGDGQTLNSQAFADAIDAVSEKGGGTLVIPAGIWLTGPIILKSNLELYTEPGALVLFSTDKDLYPLVKTSFEGLDTWRCISPIYGDGLENIAFTGSGVWDGSGDAWRFVKRGKLTDGQWNKLVASGGVVNEKGDKWYPSVQYMMADQNANMNVPANLKTKEDYQKIRDFLRPVLMGIKNSKRVMLDGPTFQNSPAWNLHPLMVEDLIVRNITVRNPWYSQNGDGLDVESCKNVLVENSRFDVGDDAICIKSGKDEDGRKRGIPCENLVIRNNIVYHGHGGVVVGSEMSGGVKNMHVSNCTFIGTDVGLRFKSRRGRGGVVEGIYISDVRMTNIPTNAISFNLYYGGKSVSEMLASGGPEATPEVFPVTEETPQFKDIYMKDVTVNGALQAVYVQGLPEMNVENVVMENMVLKTKKGILLIDSKNIAFKNVKLETTETHKGMEIFNCTNVDASGLTIDLNAEDNISIFGSNNKNISITAEAKAHTKTGKNVSGDVFTVN